MQIKCRCVFGKIILSLDVLAVVHEANKLQSHLDICMKHI